LPLLKFQPSYYVSWVCVCSLRYAACIARATYCHLWPVRLHNIFSTLSHKGDGFRKKGYWTQNVCFNFLYKFCLKHFSF